MILMRVVKNLEELNLEVRFLRLHRRKIKASNLLQRIESLNAYNHQLTNNKTESKDIKGNRKKEIFWLLDSQKTSCGNLH